MAHRSTPSADGTANGGELGAVLLIIYGGSSSNRALLIALLVVTELEQSSFVVRQRNSKT